ncbi:helix-turn-helix transcriptional regulator [Nocardia sp. NPDC052566]|uniref:helix-turn-helix transcriptional regulator n=1 Tax=Nocardia sp. NPDC052566 TaxID=3364330 RepID=UPI0037C871F6
MSELGDFLKAKRAAITPDQVGLPPIGNPRRVRGLRREEVAQLAALSVDHYTRLEQGRVTSASDNVLDGIARGLRLTEDERSYLRLLAQPPTVRRGTRAVERVSPRVLDLLAATTAPALVLGATSDILAWNPQAATLFFDFAEIPAGQRNMVRLLFLEPRMRALFADWPSVAAEAVARLRMAAVRGGDDPKLATLVGELSLHDADFRCLWAWHHVRVADAGRKVLRHPLVGDLEVDWQAFVIAAAEGQTLVTYTAPADSKAHEALRFLDAWSPDPVVGTEKGGVFGG